MLYHSPEKSQLQGRYRLSAALYDDMSVKKAGRSLKPRLVLFYVHDTTLYTYYVLYV